MKEKLLSFLEKCLTGQYNLKIGKKYLHFPRLAVAFTISFLITFIGDSFRISPITYLGYFLIAMCIFGFFFYRIFPERRKIYKIK